MRGLCIEDSCLRPYDECIQTTQQKDKATTKIALVTGASRGLGKSTALNLAKKGVDVIVSKSPAVSLIQT